MKDETKGRKQNTKREGCVLGIAALSLLAYSIVHHYTDPVRYDWGLSPYLFPTILAAVLLLLAAALLVKRECSPAEDGEARK